MAIYGESLTIQYIAWDTVNNVPKTGDASNHTLRWVKDGTAAAPTNAPSEVDAANAPGLYKLTLTATETQCWVGTLCGKSSTSGVVIMPLTLTFERLPTAAPGSSGGLPLIGMAPLTNLDAAVSSRSTLTASDVWSYASRTLSGFGFQVTVGGYTTGQSPSEQLQALGYSSARAAKLDNLDAAVSSRLAASDYVAPDNASIASIKSKTDAYLDAAVSSRLAASAYTPPDNASISSIKNTVDTKLDATISSRAPANTALSNTVWTDAKADFLDAAISSRLAASDYTPPDNASIASIKNTVDSKLDVNVASRAPASTALSNEIWTNAKAAYLDAAISSRLDASSYVAPDNTSISAIKTQTDKFQFDSNNYVYAVGIGGESGTDWTDTEKQQIRYRLGIDGATQAPSTNSPHLGSSYSTLDDLAAHVSTRLAASAYTPPDNASITAIKTKTDQLSFDSGKVAAKISDPVSVSSSDISAIVDGVWDELISQHTTTGSAGAVLAAASDDGTSPGTIVCSPVIYPLQLSTAPRTSGPSITWYTGEKPAASFVIKSTDLTTKDVVLSVFALANPQEVLLEAAGSVAYSEATLTSTVNISLDELVLAPSFAYRYILKNVTDDTVLASGPLYVISVPA